MGSHIYVAASPNIMVQEVVLLVVYSVLFILKERRPDVLHIEMDGLFVHMLISHHNKLIPNWHN